MRKGVVGGPGILRDGQRRVGGKSIVVADDEVFKAIVRPELGMFFPLYLRLFFFLRALAAS